MSDFLYYFICNLMFFCIFARITKNTSFKDMKKNHLFIISLLLTMAVHTNAASVKEHSDHSTQKETAATSTFETATNFIQNMKVGWNLGNALDANNQSETDFTKASYWGQQDLSSETCWGQFFTKPQLMTMLKNAGFGAIRVPVTWYNHCDIDGNIDQSWMKRVREVVDYVINAGMYCIINVHHDTGANSDKWKSWIIAAPNNYTANKARYEKIWKQIAEEFKDYSQLLLFESYNEMLDARSSWNFASYNSSNHYDATEAAAAYAAINSYATSFVNTVRASGGNNHQRNLIVNTYGACASYGNWNTHLTDPLKNMNKPDGETDHILFEVHTYPDVTNLSNAKSGVDNMIKNLNDHLVSKGAPVIIGEWGTSNVDGGEGKTDYDVRRANVLEFANYFVKKTKENHIGTFHWMGISDGMARLYPAFTQPDLALKILQAWYGESYNPTLPTMDNFKNATISATINYTSQWGEFYIFKGSINSADYQGIQIEFDPVPGSGKAQLKVYCNSQAFKDCTETKTTMNFTPAMGNITGITLQWKLKESGDVNIKSVWLLKKDGTKVSTSYSIFWGCKMTDINISTGISPVTITPTDHDAIYNLSGQRITNTTKGIYIRGGKKFIVR